MPAGQPTKYKPEYCQMLIEHLAEGLSFASFAALASCSHKTLYSWLEQFPEFKEAREIGTPKGRLFWEKLGVDNIVNESIDGHSRSLNGSLWQFNMKNRFGWRDKRPEEVAKTIVNNNTEVTVKPEISERIEQIKGNK